MNTKATYIFCCLLVTLSAIGQDYKWSDNPTVLAPRPEWNDQPGYIGYHYREYALRTQKREWKTLLTEHKVVHVNSQAGIEKFNKVYIPMRAGMELNSLDVRAISPQGQVTVMKKSSLKELTNMEGFGNFKIFAIEGLVVGGDLEYIYSTTMSPQAFGTVDLQQDAPVVASKVDVVFPEMNRYQVKPYGGKVKILETPEKGNYFRISSEASMVPALKEEDYASPRANRIRLAYKIRNESTTTEEVCKRFATSSFESNAVNKVGKFVDDLHLEGMTLLDMIRTVERTIKTTFTLREGGGEEFSDPRNVIANRAGNERGMMALYMIIWRKLQLKQELVLCSDRFRGVLDPAFLIPSDITDVLFYFPDLNVYLIPDAISQRVGLPPDRLMGSTAIFIKVDVPYAKAVYLGHEVRRVPVRSTDLSQLGVKARVSFKGGMDKPVIQQENYYQGNRAFLMRGTYRSAPEDRRDDFIKQVTLSSFENVNVISTTLEGQDIELNGDPKAFMRIKTEYTTPLLIESAGEDYLVAVGKLIGRQSELYQEKDRTYPIEISEISNYYHELVIEIPYGYTIDGLDAIKIRNALVYENEEVAKFESTFAITGNTLTIKITEVYKVLSLPKELYEDFRKVINSAADFNKVVLSLHPAKK